MEKIQIIKSPSRVFVFSPYDIKLQNFFRGFEKRFWDNTLREWSFPITALDDIVGFFANENRDFEILDPDAVIYVNNCWPDSELAVKFRKWFDQLDELKALPGVLYSQDRKLFYFPADQELVVESLLNKNGFGTIKRNLNAPPPLKRRIDCSQDVDCTPFKRVK